MAKVSKIKLSTAGLSQATFGAISQIVQEIAGRAGSGFEGDVVQGKRRPHGVVKAVSFEARRDNAKNNTLLKSTQGGGG